MTPYQYYTLASVLAGLGLWLMLPRGRGAGFWGGFLLAAIALALLAAKVPVVSGLVTRSVFMVLGGVTLVSALLTVTSRNPVYCAIWFALSLLAAGGMMLVGGAQFLGVATVVVYAGAILVTFLFVLMLAQPEGHAYYDRASWEAHFAAFSGAVMVGVLTLTVASVLGGSGVRAQVEDMADAAKAEAAAASAAQADPLADANPDQAADAVQPAAAAADPRLAQLRRGVLAEQHMARLGGQLFSRHLVAIEVAGTLLLVALVAAVAIVAHGRGVSTLATELRIVTRRPSSKAAKA